MNFVGPRPVHPIFLETRGGDMFRCSAHLTVRPGLTDIAPEGNGYFSEAQGTLRARRLSPTALAARRPTYGADAALWVVP
jgi:hypothetical protein